MVGDRISVSGVTGDVIYVGLVRLYLTELAGAGSDMHPTGRVVVISNSVLFMGTPLLKQIPGTAYAWHEVVVKLERDSDYSLAERKLLEAVNSVYSLYRESIEEQHQSLKGLMTVSRWFPPHKRGCSWWKRGWILWCDTLWCSIARRKSTIKWPEK
jgi:small-conductance mechanosensitive channel